MFNLELNCIDCSKALSRDNQNSPGNKLKEKCHSCYRKALVENQKDRCFFCDGTKTSNWYLVFNKKKESFKRKQEQDSNEMKILNSLGNLEPLPQDENWSGTIEGFSGDLGKKIRLVQCVRCYVLEKSFK